MKKLFLIAGIIFVSTFAHASDSKTTAKSFMDDYMKFHGISYFDSTKYFKYFTKDLRSKFDTAIKNEEYSVKHTPKDEKPCIPDADIFFAMAEGANGYEIIAAMDNQVDIKLIWDQKNGSAPYIYKAEIITKTEDGKVVIDNIHSTLDNGSKVDLKERLKHSDCK